MSKEKVYIPKPYDTSDVHIPPELIPLIDMMSYNNHEVWARGRQAEGWTYGYSAEDKQNELLKPYDEMTDEERLPDVNTVSETIKFLLAKGYSIEPKSEEQQKKKSRKKKNEFYWKNAEEKYWKQFYPNENEPEYRIPVLIGLVSDDCPECNFGRVCAAVAQHIEQLNNDFGSKRRTTPFYLLSALKNDMEKRVAQHIRQKYSIDCIHVSDGSENTSGIAAKSLICDDPDQYIAENEFILLALWDGISIDTRAGKLVTNTLIEAKSVPSQDIPNEITIGDSRPVFQVILPFNNDSADDYSMFEYKTRVLLPHILESGCQWFKLNRAAIDKNGEVIDDFESTDELHGSLGELQRIITKSNETIAELKSNAAEYTYLSSSKRKESIQNLEKSRDMWNERLRKSISYNKTIRASKLDRYEQNVKTIECLNRKVTCVNRLSDKNPAFNILDDNQCGISKAADASHVRHIRCDTISTGMQNKNRRLTSAMAWFAGIGLGAYALLSDAADPHSLLGILSAIISACFILAALVIFFAQRKSNSHYTHVEMRMLSEGLRIKTFWNALGMYDYNADMGFVSRKKIDLEYAVTAFRAWQVLDRCSGYYDKNVNGSIEKTGIVKNWIGTPDVSNDAGAYEPTINGQVMYARKTSREFLPKAEQLNRVRNTSICLVVVATLAIAALLIIRFIKNADISSLLSMKAWFSSGYETSTTFELIEKLVAFGISIIPIFAACRVMYGNTCMYEQNIKRYKWLALQYQKGIEMLQNAQNDSEKEEIIACLGKMAVSEVSEWTSMVVNVDTELPF